jgi:hypothetical protein
MGCENNSSNRKATITQLTNAKHRAKCFSSIVVLLPYRPQLHSGFYVQVAERTQKLGGGGEKFFNRHPVRWRWK